MKKLFNQKEIENLKNNLFVVSIDQTIDSCKNVAIEIVFNNNCKLSAYLYSSIDGYTFRNLKIKKDSILTVSEYIQLNKYLNKSHCKTFQRVKNAKTFIYSFIKEFKDILSECRYKFISIFDADETYFGSELCETLADRVWISNNYVMKQNFRTARDNYSSINVLFSLACRPNVHFTSEYMALNGKHLVAKKMISGEKVVSEENIMLDGLEDVYMYVIEQIEIEHKKSEIDEGFRLFDDDSYNSIYGYRYSVGKVFSLGENRRHFDGVVEKTTQRETMYFNGNFKQEINIHNFHGGSIELVVREYVGNETSELDIDPEVIIHDCNSKEKAVCIARHIAKNGTRRIKTFKDVLDKMWALGELKNRPLVNIKTWAEEHSDEDMSYIYSSLLRVKKIAEMEINIANMYSVAVNNGYKESYNEFFAKHIDNTVISNTKNLPISLEDRSNMTQEDIVEATQLDLINEMINIID